MAFHYGRRKMLASYGHFRGLNVMRYPNGSIGPRPALVHMSTIDHTVSGTVKWAFYVPGEDQLVLLTHTGNIYRLANAYAGGTSWTGVALGVTPLSATIYQNDLYVGAVGGVYRSTAAGALAGPFANSPANCGFLASYREFLVGVNTSAALGSTLAYTNPGDGTTWPVANTITIGSGNDKITGLMTQRNSLVVPLLSGEWWTTTGFLGADGSAGNDITRRADIGMAFTGAGGPVFQSSIWYINGRDACNFTGAAISIEPLPDPPIINPLSTFPVLPGEASLLTFSGLASLFGPNSFLLTGTAVPSGGSQINFGFMRNGTDGWTRHTFPLTTATPTHPILVSLPYGVVWFIAQTGTTASTYSWNPRQEVPYTDGARNPLVSDLDGSSGAVVSGSFSLPEWWTPDGGGVHIAGAMVDFEYDADAIAAANDLTVCGFSIGVDALNNPHADGVRSAGPLPWAPPTEVTTRAISTTGRQMIRRREIFRFGDQGMGSGFQINLTNMRGIQVYRVVAVADIDESRIF